MQSVNIGAGVNMENKMSKVKDKFYIRSGNHRLLVEEIDEGWVMMIFFTNLFKDRFVDADTENHSVFIDKTNLQLAKTICISRVGYGGMDCRTEICGNDPAETELYDNMHANDLYVNTNECLNGFIKVMKQAYNVNIVLTDGDEKDSTYE